MRLRPTGWGAIRAVSLLAYVFLFGPVAVVVLLSFNPLEFGSFPLKGLTLRWYVELAHDRQIADAVKTSLMLGSATALISTVGGVAAALALVRYDFPGRQIVATLLTLPILLPQVVLGVAVLLFLRSLGMPTSFALLLLGHVTITLPLVVVVAQARLYAIPEVYEEAAMSLGASRWHAFKDVTLPLMAPAILAGGLFAFTTSFDDITATLFWKPTGVETVPTQILAMLRLSMSQEINALGTAMILVTLALPLTALAIVSLVGRRETGMSVAVLLEGVDKHYGTVPAVVNFDLRVDEGSFVTLLGPSGCGKTTVLRMIAGLTPPTAGDILVKGRRVNDVPIHQRNLGLVFQNLALFPHRTVVENVAYGLKFRRLTSHERQAKVARALETVRLPGLGDRFPSQLSGGQQQRVALARAIVIGPDVLLLDEPLSSLDAGLREEMRVELKTIQRELRITTIFVTHDQAEALAMSDRIVVMHEGRKEQDGTPQDVYARPRSRFVAGFLGHSNFLDGRLEDGDGSFAWLQVDQGPRVQVPAPAGRVGGRALAVLRAERIVLGDAPTGPGVTRLVARVTAVDYQGTTVRYFLDVDGFRLQVIDTIDGPPLAEGTSVTVTIRGNDCVLLPDTK